MTQLLKALNRTVDLSKKDLADGRTYCEYFASLIEELGELARAIKAENNITNRKLDETALSESVDYIIASLFFHVISGGDIDDNEVSRRLQSFTTSGVPYPEKNPFELLARMSNSLGFLGLYVHLNIDRPFDCLEVIRDACDMFQCLGGTEDFLVATLNKKLDKWESNQKS